MTDETKAIPLGETFEDVFDGIAFEALQILYQRQRKYGPENIRQLGLFGVFDRLASDKVERVRKAFNGILHAGRIILDDLDDANMDDESFEDALFDISNYALIMIAVKRGVWGRPLRADTDELQALAGSEVRQLDEEGETYVRASEQLDEGLPPVVQEGEAHAFVGYSPASRFCLVEWCDAKPEDAIHAPSIGKDMGEPS